MKSRIAVRRVFLAAVCFVAACGIVSADWCGEYRKARDESAGAACANAEKRLRKLIKDRPKPGKNILCPGGLLEPMDVYCPRLYLAVSLACQGKDPEEVRDLLARIDAEEATNFSGMEKQIYARLVETVKTSAPPTPTSAPTTAPPVTPAPTVVPQPTPRLPAATPTPAATATPGGPWPRPTPSRTAFPEATRTPRPAPTEPRQPGSPTPTKQPGADRPETPVTCTFTPEQSVDLKRAHNLCDAFDYAKARPVLERVLGACPDDAEGNLLLGICYAFEHFLYPGEDGDAVARALKDKALEHFARAYRGNPGVPWDRDLYGPRFVELYEHASRMR